MTMTIYYFSGTGNSLHAARTIAAQAGDCKLVSIAKVAGSPEIVETGDTVGFVFPVYFGDLPDIVRRAVSRMKLGGSAYVFAVATCGGMPGKTLFTLDRLLRGKGARLSAGFSLDMPDNAYVKMNLITPPERREPMLSAAEARLGEIIAIIQKRGQPGIAGKNGISTNIMLGSMKLLMTKGFRIQRGLRSTDRCTGCGTCQKVCPTGNISVEGNKVKWGDKCVLCLACFHWCPQEAIQADKRSEGIARYHHPQVTANDIACRQE